MFPNKIVTLKWYHCLIGMSLFLGLGAYIWHLSRRAVAKLSTISYANSSVAEINQANLEVMLYAIFCLGSLVLAGDMLYLAIVAYRRDRSNARQPV